MLFNSSDKCFTGSGSISVTADRQARHSYPQNCFIKGEEILQLLIRELLPLLGNNCAVMKGKSDWAYRE